MINMIRFIMVLSIASSVGSAAEPGEWIDLQGDAVIRRTDIGNNAPLPPNFEPIDLLSVSAKGWMPTSPTSDLYTGSIISGEADFVRIQIIVDGLVTPPGPIGLNGFPYNPTQFGDRPITGYIDLDIDDQKNSGGELMPLARNRYLANVARFGNSPQGSIAERMVQDSSDFDGNFFTGAQFERTGAEFTLSLCGCFSPILLTENGDMDSIFDPGETWTLLGQYFERFESFAPLSGIFGGTSFGIFNPGTRIQFAHDTTLDLTTITLVFPITNAGAALQTGQPEQPIDSSISNHTSMEEAIDDLIFGAGFATQELDVLTQDWQDNEVFDYRDPTLWSITALIGTAPTQPQPSSFYIWTDTGFDERHADFNFDNLATINDVQGSKTLSVKTTAHRPTQTT